MRHTISSAKKRAKTTKARHTADSKGWVKVNYFGNYLIIAKDNIRKLVDPDTGWVQLEYRIDPPKKVI